MTETKGTIREGEYHPAADSAMRYLNSLGVLKLMQHQESFASCAIEGNRLAEICSETLSRVLNKDKLSDRYLLGLAWTIRSMEEGYDRKENG